MRRWLLVLALLIGSQAIAQQAVQSIPFESVQNPLQLPTRAVHDFIESKGIPDLARI